MEQVRARARSRSDGAAGVFRSRARLQSVLDRIGDGVTVQDRAGRLVYANDAAARMLGFDTARELLATPVADVLRRFELLDAERSPFPVERLPGRLVLEHGSAEPTLVCYRIRATGEERWALVHATPLAAEGGEVAHAVNVFHDVTAVKREDERARFMAEVTSVLNRSLELDQTLAELGRLTVPAFADLCLVDLVGEAGALEELVCTHADPEREEVLRELRRRYGIERGDGHPATVALAEERLVHLEEMRPEDLRAAASQPGQLELYERLGLRSYVVAPLRSRGRSLGTLSLGTDVSGRRLGPPEAVFAQQLANRVAAAVDNALLYREAGRRADAARALRFIGEGVLLVDAHDVVRVWNPAAEAITGLPRAAVVGRPADEALAEWAALATAAAGAARPTTVPVESGGAERWLSLSRADFAEGAVVAFRDVTEERRLERLKDEFVATVSHQLRTPVAAVYGAARTLARSDVHLDGAARERLLELVQQGAERLTRIVSDILAAGQLERERVPLAIERCDVAATARRAVEAAELVLPGNLTLTSSFPDGLPPVRADEARVEQVLANLLENAIRYSPDGGAIVVRAEPAGDAVRIAVEDEGLGIPPAERERVFDRFYRLDPRLTRGVDGTGLGLYICRELVERMGGRISVEGRPGPGTLVSFELPAA